MAAANVIEIYQRNSGTISCVITGIDDITGYDSYLSVKAKEADASTLIFKSGVVQDPCTLTFEVTSTDSSLAVGDYIYDINIELDDSSIFTVRKNVFSILDGVRH